MSASDAKGSGAKALEAEIDETLKRRREEQTRIAALILEVIGGERSSGEAASELDVSLTRYYKLEERAIRGLVEACAPRRRGAAQNPEREVLRLKAEVKRLESQCRRTANLLRLSQRDLGIRPSRSTETAKKGSTKSGKKTRRMRRGKSRALTLAEKLRSGNPKTMDAAKTDGENPGEVKAD